MNLDRKFLEGFSEVSAANGLTPSQAHQLLTKEAGLGSLAAKVIKPLVFNKFMAYNTPALAVGGYFGGKHLLNKADKAFTDYGDSVRSSPVLNCFKKSSDNKSSTTIDQLPYYTKWDSEGRGSSYAPRPTPAPETITTRGVKSDYKGVPIMGSKSNMTEEEARVQANLSRQFDEAKQQKDMTSKKIVEMDATIAKLNEDMYSPNILNKIDYIGEYMAGRRSNKLAEQTRIKNELTEKELRYADDVARLRRLLPEKRFPE